MHALLKWALALSLFSTNVAIAVEELISLDSREGVKQKFILEKSDTAAASVILFAGGKGALDLYQGVFGGSGMNWGKNNFLVRTRNLFHNHGFNVVTIDAPSDRQGQKGMLNGFRDSSEHVQDIDTVIKYLKTEFNKPVWLVGTSRGVESAANVALNTQAGIDGLVLTSSMTEKNNSGVSLPEMPLKNIKVPVMITHHKNDGCRKTTPAGARQIQSMLSGAKVAELKLYEGGNETSKNPCEAMTHHGYLGIEAAVIDDIAAFIKQHSTH